MKIQAPDGDHQGRPVPHFRVRRDWRPDHREDLAMRGRGTDSGRDGEVQGGEGGLLHLHHHQERRPEGYRQIQDPHREQERS